MDGRRFDEWTRMVARGASRRTALRAAAGGAIATLGLLRSATAETTGGTDATCKCGFGGHRFCQSEHCDSDEECCSRKCVSFQGFHDSKGNACKPAGKRCLCRFKGARCGKDCACCSGRCQSNGRCA